MHYGFGHAAGWWGMGLGIIGHLAFTIIIIILAVWLFRNFSGRGRQEMEPDVFEILKLRYAKGEITSVEYQQLKKELE